MPNPEDKPYTGKATDWLEMGRRCGVKAEDLLVMHALQKILDPKITDPQEALRQMAILKEIGIIGNKG